MKATSFPPQAYTRETLLQAFDWFNKQPPSTKRLAKTVDSLVSLYLTQMRREKSHFYTEENEEKKKKLSFSKTLESQKERGEKKGGNSDFSNSHSQFVSTQVVRKNITQKTTHRTEIFKKHLKNLSSLNEPPSFSSEAPPQVTKTLPSPFLTQEKPEEARETLSSPKKPLFKEPLKESPQGELFPKKEDIEKRGSFELEPFLKLLDPKSFKLIQDVKIRLNLSSEEEALRLLLSLGYEKIHPLLPT